MLSFAANIPQGLGSCVTQQRSTFCHTTLCGECRPPTNVSHVRPFRAKALTRKQMVNAIFSPESSYLPEGRAILAEEFGPDYGVYFTILSAIASGATTTAEMKNLIGVDVNGYLTKLEDQYQLVSKKQPIFDSPTGKNCHYQIDDCFFRFWFRFVFKYRGYIELERYDLWQSRGRPFFMV